MRLPVLYHWSPKERREAILREGLQMYAPTLNPSYNDTTGGTVVGWPYVCLGTDPATAWSLSGAMDWAEEIEDWDLWQVTLADADEVSIRGDFGPEIQEVRVRNTISPDRLWWIGERQPMVAKEVVATDRTTAGNGRRKRR